MAHPEHLKIIATMTTIPSRIDHIRPVIEAALGQSVTVSGIDINVPFSLKRTGEKYVLPKWLAEIDRVSVFRTEDYGSITKIAPTLERHLLDTETFIWSIDDDVALPANQLELLLQGYRDGHQRILTRYGGALNDGADFQNWFGEGRVTFIEGFGGVLYPPGCVQPGFMDYIRATSSSDDCRRSDDVVLSMYFNQVGIEMYLYNKPSDRVPYMVEGWLPHTRNDALSEGGHRERYGRVVKFIKELPEFLVAGMPPTASISMETSSLSQERPGSPHDCESHPDTRTHSACVDNKGLKGMESLCVATSYTSDFKDIGDYGAMGIRTYAAFHKAVAYVDSNLTFSERPAPWHRVKLIADLFRSGVDFVLWVDADAAFIRFDVDVRSVVMPGKDLYIVEHTYPQGGRVVTVPNTGVMLIRNTVWSQNLLQKMWALSQYTDHIYWENAALIHLLGRHSLLGDGSDVYESDICDRVAFLPLEWNSLPYRETARVDHPIIVHYAGEPRDRRVRELPRCALQGTYAALSQINRQMLDLAAR